MSRYRFVWAGLFLVAATAPHAVLGQSTGPADVLRPPSGTGGYAGREMNQIYRQSVGRGYTINDINSITLRNSQVSLGGVANVRLTQSSLSTGSYLPSAKPFSAASPSPTVSPYLNLFNENFDDVGSSPYVSLVRPMLDQQRMNQQLQLQQQQLDRRVQEIAAQPAFAPRGSETQYPTGHPTVFMNTGRFYPLNLRRR